MTIDFKKQDPELIKSAVVYLKEYVGTYDTQVGYEQYSIAILINDMLYGLGVSLDKKYQYHPGYLRFRKELARFLEEE